VSFYISTSKYFRFVFISLLSIVSASIAYFAFAENYAYNRILASQEKNHYRLLENGSSYDNIIMGTSHTNYTNKIARKTLFSYGRPRTYPVIMYIKLKHILKNAPNIKHIIIEADAHQFYDWSHLSDKSRYKLLFDDNYLKDINSKLIIETKDAIESRGFISTNDEIAPIIHKKLLIDLLPVYKKKKKKKIRKQWHKFSEEARNKKAIKRLKHFNLYNNKEMNKTSKYFYEKTISTAIKNNIKVTLIRHPMTNEYLSLMNERVVKDVDEYIYTLSRKYALKSLDYRFIFKDNQSYFENQDHLHPSSFEKFNNILLKDINLLISSH
jgi:hypothetical protein